MNWGFLPVFNLVFQSPSFLFHSLTHYFYRVRSFRSGWSKVKVEVVKHRNLGVRWMNWEPRCLVHFVLIIDVLISPNTVTIRVTYYKYPGLIYRPWWWWGRKTMTDLLSLSSMSGTRSRSWNVGNLNLPTTRVSLIHDSGYPWLSMSSSCNWMKRSMK